MYTTFLHYDTAGNRIFRISSTPPSFGKYLLMKTERRYSDLDPIYLGVCVYNRKDEKFRDSAKLKLPYPENFKVDTLIWEANLPEMPVYGASNGYKPGQFYVLAKMGVSANSVYGLISENVIKSSTNTQNKNHGKNKK